MSEVRSKDGNKRDMAFRQSVLLAALLTFPALSLANAGTPLMWAGFLHLTIGNLVLGVVEGLLLAWLVKAPKLRCVILLTVANFFSAWIGWGAVVATTHSVVDLNLHNVSAFLLLSILVAYLYTLLFEFPFIWFALFGEENRRTKAIKGTLVVQSISYLVLFGFYFSVSYFTFATQADAVDPSRIAIPEGITMYFVSTEDGALYKRPLDGGDIEFVMQIEADQRYHSLAFLPAEELTDSAEKYVLSPQDHFYLEPTSDTILLETELEAAPIQSGYRDVARLDSAVNSDWNFWVGFWSASGLSGENEATGEKLQFAMETPFLQWSVRSATHLPGDMVLFQLGAEQICILDSNERSIAVIERGAAPIAVIE